ncbi:MAG: hypothetical protein P1U62_13735, partial [Alteraurantiacibacter sp. bin_em_oilr2.035]|nr:hypothetical protein [Alteraurantiacibacter sp. bin_em_oilr2.035]
MALVKAVPDTFTKGVVFWRLDVAGDVSSTPKDAVSPDYEVALAAPFPPYGRIKGQFPASRIELPSLAHSRIEIDAERFPATIGACDEHRTRSAAHDECHITLRFQ